jgi:hypothetical protein
MNKYLHQFYIKFLFHRTFPNIFIDMTKNSHRPAAHAHSHEKKIRNRKPAALAQPAKGK